MVTIDARAQPISLLPASRRLDWRFLLPDPNLGQVAYTGPERGALLEALKLFSAALTVIENPPPVDLPPAQYDLVVAKQPAPTPLVVAAAMVRPGGFLYIEALGRVGLRGLSGNDQLGLGANRRRLLQPTDYVMTLRQLGFVHVDVHWHWPNFEACLEIVPLYSPAAMRHALARRRSDAAAQLKSAFGRWLLSNGWLPRMIPYFSVVAQMRT